jgi:hypothetical protein
MVSENLASLGWKIKNEVKFLEFRYGARIGWWLKSFYLIRYIYEPVLC